MSQRLNKTQVREELRRRLSEINEAYREIEFNPLPQVVNILKVSPSEQTELLERLEQQFGSMEESIGFIVDGFETKNYIYLIFLILFKSLFSGF